MNQKKKYKMELKCMNSGGLSNFFEVVINEVGFVISIIILGISLYLLKFKIKDMNKVQIISVTIALIISLSILAVFIYLIIGFGKVPENIPKPITK